MSVITDLNKKDIPGFMKDETFKGSDHFIIAERINLPIKDKGDLGSYFDALFFMDCEERADMFLFLDFETNTLNGYAVSMGAVLYKLSTGEVQKIYELFNPIDPIDKEAEEVHGISMKDVAKEKTFEEKQDLILDLIDKADCIVAHNALYDIGVLVREFERMGLVPFPKFNFLDTMSRVKKDVMAKSKTGRLKDATLEEMASFFGIDTSNVNLHNSMEDAFLLHSAFVKAIDRHIDVQKSILLDS